MHLQRRRCCYCVVHEGGFELVVLVVANDAAWQGVEAEQVRQHPICGPRYRFMRRQRRANELRSSYPFTSQPAGYKAGSRRYHTGTAQAASPSGHGDGLLYNWLDHVSSAADESGLQPASLHSARSGLAISTQAICDDVHGHVMARIVSEVRVRVMAQGSCRVRIRYAVTGDAPGLCTTQLSMTSGCGSSMCASSSASNACASLYRNRYRFTSSVTCGTLRGPAQRRAGVFTSIVCACNRLQTSGVLHSAYDAQLQQRTLVLQYATTLRLGTTGSWHLCRGLCCRSSTGWTTSTWPLQRRERVKGD